jgi:hypothetical protein
VTGVAYAKPRDAFAYRVLADAFVPSARKLPFLALALVSLALVILAAGIIPAPYASHPALVETLTKRRSELAVIGLFTLGASIIAYLLV